LLPEQHLDPLVIVEFHPIADLARLLNISDIDRQHRLLNGIWPMRNRKLWFGIAQLRPWL